MKPIFFPFTYISRPLAEILYKLFGKIVVYQPSHQKIPGSMDELSENGMLDLRVPVIKDKNIVGTMLKECLAWTNLHKGDRGLMKEFLKTNGEAIPFFNYSLTPQIKADIQKRSKGKQKPIKHDALLGAILFLHIAQEFDMQNWGINQELLNAEKIEENLFRNLKGENEFTQTAPVIKKLLADDPCDYMTADRIKAWSLIMQRDPDISGLFITNNRSAFDYCADKGPGAKIIYKFESIPTDEGSIGKIEKWRDSLIKHFEGPADNLREWPDKIIKELGFIEKSNEKVSMTFSIISGESPYKFFARCTGIKPHEHVETKGDLRFENTILAFVES